MLKRMFLFFDDLLLFTWCETWIIIFVDIVSNIYPFFTNIFSLYRHYFDFECGCERKPFRDGRNRNQFIWCMGRFTAFHYYIWTWSGGLFELYGPNFFGPLCKVSDTVFGRCATKCSQLYSGYRLWGSRCLEMCPAFKSTRKSWF